MLLLPAIASGCRKGGLPIRRRLDNLPHNYKNNCHHKYRYSHKHKHMK